MSSGGSEECGKCGRNWRKEGEKAWRERRKGKRVKGEDKGEQEGWKEVMEGGGTGRTEKMKGNEKEEEGRSRGKRKREEIKERTFRS